MKKLLSYIAITALAAITLTACGQKQQQEETEKEVALKVTYSIQCSEDLMDLCDLVVTYKGDDGVNTVDTITANPADTTSVIEWSKTVKTTMIPVKIGFDYTFVPKTDTLIIDQPVASLNAIGTIIAEKIGTRKGIAHLSERTINDKTNFFVGCNMMDENVVNTWKNLATIIDVYNERQAYYRGTATSNTCFIVKPHPHGKSLRVEKACWNDVAIQ